MKPKDNVEKTIQDKLNFTADAGLYSRMLKDVLNAQDKSRVTQSASPNTTRGTIMKKPVIRLAAAVVIVAIVLGIFELIETENKSGVVWANVIEITEQIPAITFDMTAEIELPNNEKMVLPSKNYVAGDYGTRSDIFRNGQLSIIRYRLPAQKIAYQIRPDQKKYWRTNLSDEEAAMNRNTDNPRELLKIILSDDYSELGLTTINGITVEGIEAKRPDIVGEDGIMRLWVDVETNLPVRIEVEMLGMEAGQMSRQRFVMENFEWNESVDESIFVPDIPDDYTLVQ